jgi:small subunit ribosomal protein S3
MGEAKTTYGVIGIKVWVYKGEVMPKSEAGAVAGAPGTPATAAPEAPAEPRKAKRPAPKAGARRGPGKPDGDRKAAGPRLPRKTDAAAADKPKAIIKRPKKIVKEGEEAAPPAAPPAAPAGEAEEKKE